MNQTAMTRRQTLFLLPQLKMMMMRAKRRIMKLV